MYYHRTAAWEASASGGSGSVAAAALESIAGLQYLSDTGSTPAMVASLYGCPVGVRAHYLSAIAVDLDDMGAVPSGGATSSTADSSVPD